MDWDTLWGQRDMSVAVFQSGYKHGFGATERCIWLLACYLFCETGLSALSELRCPSPDINDNNPHLQNAGSS